MRILNDVVDGYAALIEAMHVERDYISNLTQFTAADSIWLSTI
jgi:hypothetical protein